MAQETLLVKVRVAWWWPLFMLGAELWTRLRLPVSEQLVLAVVSAAIQLQAAQP